MKGRQGGENLDSVSTICYSPESSPQLYRTDLETPIEQKALNASQVPNAPCYLLQAKSRYLFLRDNFSAPLY